MRNGSAVMTLNHGAPVETVMYYPSGGVLVSAGGNYVRLWDILGGGVVLHEMSNHQKTITSLCLDASGKRLFTGGLDHFIKVAFYLPTLNIPRFTTRILMALCTHLLGTHQFSLWQLP